MLRLMTFGGLALEADGNSVPMRPRRLALLAVLAAAGERGITRERLLGLFWPEVTDEHGRHSLRQALYGLRSDLGLDVVRTGSSLSLDPKCLESDLGLFQAALKRGDRKEAAGWYRGPFLDGFYLSGTPEFERWVEQERSRLFESARSALQWLADEASRSGDADATLWWHQLSRLEPLSGRVAAGYIRALAAAGDRPEALAFARRHGSTLRQELDAEPDPEVQRLEAELRTMAEPSDRADPLEAGLTSSKATPATTQTPATTEPSLTGETPAPRRPRWWSLPRMAAVAVTMLATVGTIQTCRGVSRPAEASAPGDVAGAEASTRSSVASEFYQEGLRAFNASDWTAARRLMNAALRIDSTFAMAAYRTALMEFDGDPFDARQRALRLARRAPERERLTIMADLLQRDLEPSALGLAEEWAAKYPGDPQAFSSLGASQALAGNWAAASGAFERAITLQLSRPVGGAEACRACEDYLRLADVYFWWDSLTAVERTTRRALDLNPAFPLPWATLALAAARGGDSGAALAHLRRYLAGTSAAVDKQHELRVRLTLEQYDVVERLALPLLGSARPSDAMLARWMLLIALRNQGRLVEAARLLQTGRLGDSPPPAVAVETDYVNEALIALEGGDPSRAASSFETRRRIEPRSRTTGTYARWMAWNTTLTATALAAVGDTAAVRRMADTAEYWGRRSLFGRDRKAHHFLRGLLLAMEGRDAEAVIEYRDAVHSLTLGFTRINYEMAKSLLRLDRPLEAIAVLQPALRGEIDAANLYVTRTELHELLAQAYDRAGLRDRAAPHHRAVVQAWLNADPQFAARRLAGQRRLNQYLSATRHSQPSWNGIGRAAPAN